MALAVAVESGLWPRAVEVSLRGKVAVVTGGGRGLGRAYAHALARAGARVLVNDAGVEVDGSGGSAHPAESVAREIRNSGGEALFHVESVANAEGVRSLFGQARAAWGRVDILVNNAGVVRSRPLVEMEEEDWDRVLDVHLRGTFLCCREFLRSWPGGVESGSIVNVTSGAAYAGVYPGTANYAAAKGGILSLTRVVAEEGRERGVRCNAISPLARTRMSAEVLGHETDPSLEPESVARFVVFLAGEWASGITGRVFRVERGRVGLVEFGVRDLVEIPDPLEPASFAATLRSMLGSE
ncbi:MAG: hypothetical protein KatS3mg076_2493 [Candidatus Binatia bacterium]|nr:MAG: hypothetical protein KatS3mg076_2493 [Candidatus Binatia bacterium]